MADAAVATQTETAPGTDPAALTDIATSQGLLLEQLSSLQQTVSQMSNIALPAANGGTGRKSLTAHSVLIGEGTSPVNFAVPTSNSGAALVGQGASADPIFGTVVLTQPATLATLTISDNKTLAVVHSCTLTGGDAWTLSITASKTVTFSNSITFAGTDSTTMTFPSSSANVAALNLADQTLSGGANVTSYSLGTVSSGTLTIDCGKCPLQYVTNNGAFTFAAPSNDGNCAVLITNGASAGAITFSGFTVSASTGDALTTTNTNKFIISVIRINGTSTYLIKALQ